MGELPSKLDTRDIFTLSELYSWWRYHVETFSALLAICAGNSLVPGEIPTQRPVTRSFDVFFIYARINGWVNTGEAGDLRRHHAHYDVIVMSYTCMYLIWHGPISLTL